MAIPFLKRVRSDDATIVQLQDNVDLTLRAIAEKPIVDGVVVGPIDLKSGMVNQVPHTLTRKPIGWIVLAKSANANIWDSQVANTTPKSVVYLNTSINCTVSLWLF